MPFSSVGKFSCSFYFLAGILLLAPIFSDDMLNLKNNTLRWWNVSELFIDNFHSFLSPLPSEELLLLRWSPQCRGSPPNNCWSRELLLRCPPRRNAIDAPFQSPLSSPLGTGDLHKYHHTAGAAGAGAAAAAAATVALPLEVEISLILLPPEPGLPLPQ